MKTLKYLLLLSLPILVIQSCKKERHCHCHPTEYTEYLTPMPGLNSHFKWEEALFCSKSCNKPVLVKFTAHGSCNKEMDLMISESSSIKRLINSQFVFVELYVDDRRIRLDSSEWITSKHGHVIKSLARYNTYLQAELFDANGLPLWAVVNDKGEPLGSSLSYSSKPRKFRRFLREGIKAFETYNEHNLKPIPSL